LRLWGAPTPNDAYGNLVGSGVLGAGPTLLLTAPKDQIVRSVQAALAGAAQVPEKRTGQTSFQLDPEDYMGPLGPDGEVSFYRIQERRITTGGWLAVTGINNNGDPILGPILPVPAAAFYGKSTSALAFFGTAPSNTGCLAGHPPVIDETVQAPLPMHFVLPRPSARLEIRNLGGGSVGAADAVLLVSLDRGPMIPITAGETLDSGGFGHMAGLVTEIFLAVEDNDDGCEFFINAGIDNELGG